MDPASITSLLLGAILGAIFGMLFPVLYKRALTAYGSQRTRRRIDFLSSGQVTKWLLDYYRRNESHVDLFDCRLGRTEVKIPFFTKPEWQINQRVLPDRDTVVQVTVGSTSNFPIKMSLVRRRSALGQRFFGEQKTLYLDRIEDQRDFKVYAKACVFFQMATKLIELEEETFRAAGSRIARATPLRDRCLRDLPTAEKVIERPFSIGCTTALAMKRPAGFDLLIQTRSPSTMTFGGSRAVIPNFGLEPNWTDAAQSKFSIIFYNLLKEYCEELFDYEELIDMQKLRRPSPDWFTSLPEARELLKRLENNTFWVEFLGFGIDGLNGTGNVALLAVVNDEAFASDLERGIKANWEVAEHSPSVEPLRFIDYHDPMLAQWLSEGQLQYGSAFTIDLAVKRLDEISLTSTHGQSLR